jgi:hypothetical protein
MVERNMSNAAMRGIVVPPGSRATSRAQGSRWNLGGPASLVRPTPRLNDGPLHSDIKRSLRWRYFAGAVSLTGVSSTLLLSSCF